MTLPSSELSSRMWARHQLPTRQPVTLPRPSLVGVLDDSVEQRPITVVTAPSGFGKTTVAGMWAEETAHLVAWLSLNPMEEDAVDDAIVAALESVVPRERIAVADPFGLVSDDEPPDLRHRLEAALGGVPERFVLVIDDAQRALRSLESGLLSGLLDRPPPALRLVLVGTTALELRLSRFILSDPDAVIGAEALAFDHREVQALAAAMESPVDATAVHADTGGWPIAVRLALLTRGTPRNPAAARASGLMHEYVRDVVLSGLDGELAQFVIEAAVCDELTPRFAAELTGRGDAARRLEQCRRLGLFLTRTESPAGSRYQWHSLFARHCRDVLAEEDPERLAGLRWRAATLLSESRPLEAVGHYLELGDGESAARVILDSWVGLVVGNSGAALDRACLSLPAPIGDRSAIQLVRACARAVIGEYAGAREIFDSVRGADSDEDRDQRAWEVARLFFADEREHMGAALTVVRARLAASRGPSAGEHAAIAFVVGWAEVRHRMNPDRTVETLEAAVREAIAVGDRALIRRAQEVLAYGLSWAGRLTASRILVDSLDREELEATSWVAYIGGSGAVAAGMNAYWAGDLGRAEQELRRLLAFGGPRGLSADLGRVLLAATAAATRDPRQCRRAALELQFLPRSEVAAVAWPKFRQAAVALLEEAVGHSDRALQLARALAEEQSLPFVAVHVAAIMRRSGAYAEALQVLRNHKAYGAVSYVRVATLVTNALSHWAFGQIESAHELCEEALTIAHREVIRFPFCENDPELRELLGAHVAWGTSHEAFLLSCLRPSSSGSALGELSEREGDVFEQLRTTLTTVEIADRLGVSINTVKTHQRSIYRKLGVTSRREALRRYT